MTHQGILHSHGQITAEVAETHVTSIYSKSKDALRVKYNNSSFDIANAAPGQKVCKYFEESQAEKVFHFLNANILHPSKWMIRCKNTKEKGFSGTLLHQLLDHVGSFLDSCDALSALFLHTDAEFLFQPHYNLNLRHRERQGNNQQPLLF